MQTDTSPAENAAAVTPSDSTIITSRMLSIGGAGNLVVDMKGGQAGVTIPVAAGQTLPISVQKVRAATTATGIVTFW